MYTTQLQLLPREDDVASLNDAVDALYRLGGIPYQIEVMVDGKIALKRQIEDSLDAEETQVAIKRLIQKIERKR